MKLFTKREWVALIILSTLFLINSFLNINQSWLIYFSLFLIYALALENSALARKVEDEKSRRTTMALIFKYDQFVLQQIASNEKMSPLVKNHFSAAIIIIILFAVTGNGFIVLFSVLGLAAYEGISKVIPAMEGELKETQDPLESGQVFGYEEVENESAHDERSPQINTERDL